MENVTLEFFLVIIILLLVYWNLKSYIGTVILALQLDGPAGYPFIGNSLIVNNSQALTKLGNNCQIYGKFFRLWISFMPLIFVSEPNHIKTILSGKVSRKNIFYSLLHTFVGSGLITNNGEKWKSHRRLIQPIFHMNVLETFIGSFYEHAAPLVETLKPNTNIKVSEVINNWVLLVIHKTILGVTLKNNEKSPFRQEQTPFSYRVSRPWFLLESVFKLTSIAEKELRLKAKFQEYTREILKQRLKEGPKEFPCLLDKFIELSESNPVFTHEEIINETCTFMLAGQDSVGSGLAFALYFLAKHQDIQEKVVKELNAIFGQDRFEPITIEHLNEMKYLEQCIKETLRLAPSIPIFSRVLSEDITLDEVKFPAGTNIVISPYAIHRLPHIFPEPFKFNPDRFSQDNLDKIHPFAFLPFSAGPRNCIGFKFAYLEMKTVIATILRKFQLVPVTGKENFEINYKVTMRAKGGIWVSLRERQ